MMCASSTTGSSWSGSSCRRPITGGSRWAAQGTFRSAYLDKAVSFMLGSLEADGHYFECSHGAHQPGEPSKPLPPVNGLSVRTPTVPDIGPGITFLWGP